MHGRLLRVPECVHTVIMVCLRLQLDMGEVEYSIGTGTAGITAFGEPWKVSKIRGSDV